jgi:PAS domain S-box-containing protein
MTAFLEHGSARFLESVTTLPRFPASRAGASLQSLIHSATDGVIVIDATRHIVLVNHKAEHMFGYSARHLLDKSVDVLLPPRLGPEQRRRMERLAAIRVNGRRARLGLKGWHASGDEFPVDASISRITLCGEMYLVVTLRDPQRQSAGDRRPRATCASWRCRRSRPAKSRSGGFRRSCTTTSASA